MSYQKLLSRSLFGFRGPELEAPQTCHSCKTQTLYMWVYLAHARIDSTCGDRFNDSSDKVSTPRSWHELAFLNCRLNAITFPARAVAVSSCLIKTVLNVLMHYRIATRIYLLLPNQEPYLLGCMAPRKVAQWRHTLHCRAILHPPSLEAISTPACGKSCSWHSSRNPHGNLQEDVDLSMHSGL